MNLEILIIFCLMIPLIISGVMHMYIVQKNLFPSLAVPISMKYFGKNKTWRGFIVMPFLTSFGAWIAYFLSGDLIFAGELDSIYKGFFIGVAYVVGELPNSYWKRKKGIVAGKLPASGKWMHLVVDQIDSAIPCLLVYASFNSLITGRIVLLTIAISLFVHMGMNYLLYLSGLRKEPV